MPQPLLSHGTPKSVLTGPLPRAGVSTAILDNFNRADSALSPSANWAGNILGNGYSNWNIVSNTCQNSSTANKSGYWISSFGVDQEVYLTVTTMPTSGNVALFVRIQNPGNGSTSKGYSLLVTNTGVAGQNTLQLRRHDPSLSTTILATTVASAFPLVSGDSICLRAVGNQLYALYKPAAGSWQYVLSCMDIQYPNFSGVIGMQSTVTGIVLDDFGGGAYDPSNSSVILQPPVASSVFHEPLQLSQTNPSADLTLTTSYQYVSGLTKSVTTQGLSSMWSCYVVACCEDKIGTTTQPFTASFWVGIELDGMEQIGGGGSSSSDPWTTGMEAFKALNTDKNCTNGATLTENVVAMAFGKFGPGTHTWKVMARMANASIATESQKILSTYTTMIVMVWDA